MTYSYAYSYSYGYARPVRIVTPLEMRLTQLLEYAFSAVSSVQLFLEKKTIMMIITMMIITMLL